MQFSANKSALQTELSHLVAVTERKVTIPILSNILIEASKKNIKITATDLDVTLVTSCAADVEQSGAVVVSARKLFEIVRNLPNDEISFSLADTKGDPRLIVTCGSVEYKLASQDKEHFPATPAKPKEGTGLPASVMKALVERTVYAITMEESKYALNGSLFECNGDGLLRMVATDGHRLSVATGELKHKQQHRVLVPKKALAQLAVLSGDRVKELKGKDSQERAAAKTEGDVTFLTTENHLFFEMGARLLITRQMSGQFPKWDLVLPKEADHPVLLSTREFTAALTRVALMADERSHGVKLELKKKKLLITAQSADVGEAKEEITVDHKGGEVSIGFNARYCLEFLNTVSAERITFSLKDGESPALFHPENDESYKYVVMPMRML